MLIKFRKYFRDISVIGCGNFAKVYLVERKSNQQNYAVKVFDKEILKLDDKEKLCIQQEIEILRELSHPHIVNLYSVFEGDNHIYCVSEYFEGQNLLEFLMEKGIASEKFSVNIIS